ncbi:MAG: winged helix-turn-helix domain-containing protein [Candidatus Altiarchaeota archaeon]
MKAKGGKDIAELKRLIKADEAYLHMALGWLAREDKIIIKKGKTLTAKLK